MPLDTRRSRRSIARALLAGLATSLFLALPAHAAGGGAGTGAKSTVSSKTYDYYLTGDAANAGPFHPTSQLLVLMGGGNDVSEAFKQMIARATGGLGGKVDVVVLRTSGADGYNPYLYAMGDVDSVETLVLKSQDAANDPNVISIVANADVLFIAGGDQANYISQWKGTLLESTILTLLGQNVPFGGTSAGMAVLGDVDYTAENGSIESKAALSNPYDKKLTLDGAFIRNLPGLSNTITDSHTLTRDRMGRLVTFLARMIEDKTTSVNLTRGIGVEMATAVLIENGFATVVGTSTTSAAYFLKPTVGPKTVLPKTPLEFGALQVNKVPASPTVNQAHVRFDLSSWTRTDNEAPYYLEATGGSLTSSQAGGSVY